MANLPELWKLRFDANRDARSSNRIVTGKLQENDTLKGLFTGKLLWDGGVFEILCREVPFIFLWQEPPIMSLLKICMFIIFEHVVKTLV